MWVVSLLWFAVVLSLVYAFLQPEQAQRQLLAIQSLLVGAPPNRASASSSSSGGEDEATVVAENTGKEEELRKRRRKTSSPLAAKATNNTNMSTASTTTTTTLTKECADEAKNKEKEAEPVSKQQKEGPKTAIPTSRLDAQMQKAMARLEVERNRLKDKKTVGDSKKEQQEKAEKKKQKDEASTVKLQTNKRPESTVKEEQSRQNNEEDKKTAKDDETVIALNDSNDGEKQEDVAVQATKEEAQSEKRATIEAQQAKEKAELPSDGTVDTPVEETIQQANSSSESHRSMTWVQAKKSCDEEPKEEQAVNTKQQNRKATQFFLASRTKQDMEGMKAEDEENEEEKVIDEEFNKGNEQEEKRYQARKDKLQKIFGEQIDIKESLPSIKAEKTQAPKVDAEEERKAEEKRQQASKEKLQKILGTQFDGNNDLATSSSSQDASSPLSSSSEGTKSKPAWKKSLRTNPRRFTLTGSPKLQRKRTILVESTGAPTVNVKVISEANNSNNEEQNDSTEAEGSSTTSVMPERKRRHSIGGNADFPTIPTMQSKPRDYMFKDSKKEGLILKKGTLKWNKSWLVLRGGILTLYKSNKKKVQKALSTMVASASGVGNISDKPFCFLVHSTQEVLKFSAPSQQDKDEWIQLINQEKDAVMSKILHGPATRDTTSGSMELSESTSMLLEIISAEPDNSVCADCGDPGLLFFLILLASSSS
ncbi:Src kinase-associated phosphoprotein 2 [Balamuthia mandrillaris]